MTGIALAVSGAVIVLAVIVIAIEEGRRRGKAEVEAKHAKHAVKSRERMDKILANPVGKRRKLLSFLERRHRAREAKK